MLAVVCVHNIVNLVLSKRQDSLEFKNSLPLGLIRDPILAGPVWGAAVTGAEKRRLEKGTWALVG